MDGDLPSYLLQCEEIVSQNIAPQQRTHPWMSKPTTRTTERPRMRQVAREAGGRKLFYRVSGGLAYY